MHSASVYPIKEKSINPNKYVGWLCLTSHRQRGHLETAPPFTVPCEGREARKKNCLHIFLKLTTKEDGFT